MNAHTRLPAVTHERPLFPLVCSSAELAAQVRVHCDWFSGVPDSVFRRLQPELHPYYPAPRENHALAMAFGARLGGKAPCVLMQNSGLGLCGDVLFGLFHLYRLGVFMLVSVRGELPWEEPQHRAWGRKTREVLTAFDVACFDLQAQGLEAVSHAVQSAFVRNQPTALLIHRGNIDESR